MTHFDQYLRNLVALPSNERDLLLQISKLKTFAKEQIIVQANERFDQEVFIEKGVVKAFIVDEEGNNKSTGFFEEGSFMSMASLRNHQGKSLHNYQALGTVHLMTFEAPRLRTFFSRNKQLSKIGANIKEQEMKRMAERDKCLLQVTAIDKYAAFQKCYPTIERFISQKHIASYLGITPVSLSRVKAKLKS
ncbi:Crp/Fnr family transcriptional regulator [Pontibacter sp. G13]|uniref:Crp/Fnr family transcriptional regulator n=1 Tax=Pontibacter sp. G13 TaxID=3074898 RepID=UPI00288BA78A|nr:Crp/Fnr family transcriptional regulator [Pontibacter sp. G13]WNJ18268.1 Crp/Fnr family transcriptional regulator [Pontibacter sp. G13]